MLDKLFEDFVSWCGARTWATLLFLLIFLGVIREILSLALRGEYLASLTMFILLVPWSPCIGMVLMVWMTIKSKGRKI